MPADLARVCKHLGPMEDVDQPRGEQPHDILAAEAFALGAGDPGLHREAAHDVLAADEFPVPAADPHAVPPEWSEVPRAEPATSPVATRGRDARRWVAVALAAAAGMGRVIVARRRRRACRGRHGEG